MDSSQYNTGGYSILFILRCLFLLILALLINDVSFLNLLFRAKVMVEIEMVRLKVFQEFLFSKHLVELIKTVTKKLSKEISTIFRS